MGLQDDIFEVEDALDENPALECFERITNRFGEMEAELEKFQDFYLTVRKYRAYMAMIDKGIEKDDP